MNTRSAKAKGRRLQQTVRDLILKKFKDLQEDDVRSTSMGTGGEDIQLSPKAREKFPFSIECKNTESLNVWKMMEQAEANSKGHIPLGVFKRNGSKCYCVLDLNDFLNLL